MWARLFPSEGALPSPLHTDDPRHKSVREHLPDQHEDDAHSPPPKKRARYSILPIFDKYKRYDRGDGSSIERFPLQRRDQASPSPAPESPLVEKLKRNYAALRVTLHSNGIKDIVEIEEALATEVEEKITTNISQLNKIASKARELCASSLDCEVDTQISNKDGQQRTRTMQVGRALSRYQELEAERSSQLAQLWGSWEKAQSDIDELSNKLHELFERDSFQGTSGMSSNREWADREDLDIDRRIKQVVEDMTACEDEFQEKLKDEETNILEAMLKCSLG
ncbi:hypothetical protein SAMD00023353_3800220 [Rosellinia necatrix]|uniref:Uncharacterized protein n=1 Tax=Rosellinia necatrix TaxID=77044 RepID=A0A1W2TMD9_ROSNE|nr:hypothetical protein SAMD00023353_3800220 [Rosellinia necatrix]